MIELDGELINTVSIEAELATEEVLDACVGIVHEIETGDHTKLTNRDQPNQHPIEAITGLNEALAKSGDKSYIHVQSQAAKVWVIKHDLDKMPAVVVKDSAGNTVIGESEYADKNTVIMSFSGAFSGKAFLN